MKQVLALLLLVSVAAMAMSVSPPGIRPVQMLGPRLSTPQPPLLMSPYLFVLQTAQPLLPWFLMPLPRPIPPASTLVLRPITALAW